jgi:F0F1-type ATP synthase membrane subunit b/b'
MSNLKKYLLMFAAPLLAALWALREFLLPKRKSEARAEAEKLVEAVEMEREKRLDAVQAQLESIRVERQAALEADPVDLANSIIKRN